MRRRSLLLLLILPCASCASKSPPAPPATRAAFTGQPSWLPLGQEIYRFEHDQIGGFELFIVPMRAEHDGRYYEAIFNSLPA